MLSSSNDPCYCSDAVHSVRYRTDFRFYSTMQSIYPSGHRCQNKLGMLFYFLDMKIKNFQKTKSIIYHISRQKHPQKASADRPVSLFSFMTTPNLPAIPATARQIPVYRISRQHRIEKKERADHCCKIQQRCFPGSFRISFPEKTQTISQH